ncbi:MAG: hypothetical protein AAF636_10065 [Pseudomonadota bacterium]
MSNMENLEQQLSEQARQSAVFEAAVAEIENNKRRKSAQGYAVIAGAMGYGKGSLGGGLFGKTTHGAKLFLIGFAFLLPSLLIIRELL